MLYTDGLPNRDDSARYGAVRSADIDHRLAVHLENGRLSALLNCSCGHTVASHTPAGGCVGVALGDAPCICTLTDVAVLDAAIESFGGSPYTLTPPAEPQEHD